MEKKLDNLKYILTRYDNYINASNVKGTFVVSLNTFFVGWIILNRKSLIEFFNSNYNFQITINLLVYIICLLALSIFFVIIRALFPYLKSGNSSKDSYHSHIFYGSVNNFSTPEEYKVSFNKLKDIDFEKDLNYQIWILAKGLAFKYKMLNFAMKLIYIELSLFLIILILIIFQ